MQLNRHALLEYDLNSGLMFCGTSSFMRQFRLSIETCGPTSSSVTISSGMTLITTSVPPSKEMASPMTLKYSSGRLKEILVKDNSYCKILIETIFLILRIRSIILLTFPLRYIPRNVP